MTYGLEGRCSIQLSYERMNNACTMYKRFKIKIEIYLLLPLLSRFVAVCGNQKQNLAAQSRVTRFLFLVRPDRFERPTPRFEAWCSIQLSYGRVLEVTENQSLNFSSGQSITVRLKTAQIYRPWLLFPILFNKGLQLPCYFAFRFQFNVPFP